MRLVSRHYLLAAAALLALQLPGITAAHHSPARYEADTVVAVHGQVAKVDWRNPHVYITIQGDDDRVWTLEASSTPNMQRRGRLRDSLQPGDIVTARFKPGRRSGDSMGQLLSMALEDGSLLGVMTEADAGADENSASVAADLNGTWLGSTDQAFAFLFATFDHPLTEKAKTAAAEYDESMDPIAECTIWPSPRIVAWGAFYAAEIEVTEDVVFLRNEFGKLERSVFMDGRKHPQGGARTNQGHSIGYWDGETLVVDTRLFADNRSPIAGGIPSGAQKHVIERYTLRADGSAIDIEIFLEDPEYLAAPFTAELVWHHSPELVLQPFECDPEASSRYYK